MILKKLHMALFIVIVLSVLDIGYAAEPEIPTPEPSVPYTGTAESHNTGWGLILDNDALISTSSDRDYTGGFAVALGGSRVAKFRLTLDPTLSWINRLAGLDRIFGQESSEHQMQFGIILFTPDIDETGVAQPGDRPFANLLFLQNSQFRINTSKNRVYQSSLTVGILGSGVGEAIQNAVHSVGNISNKGEYGNQISDGGELTARYALSRQSLLLSRFSKRGNAFELKYSVGGDIGYITEGSATLATRWGRVESPWWSFAPTRSNYLPQQVPAGRDRFRASGAGDFYVWSAITVRARAYNAFLQGQFRPSEVTFAAGELNHILGEVSVGLNKRFGNAIDVSLSMHLQTNEIKSGAGSRNIRWGGLAINISF